MNSLSLLRQAQYRHLALISLRGLTLDIGGSHQSGYDALFKGTSTKIALNINPHYGCDVVGDITKRFPIRDRSVNAILCLNVLEHIPNPQHVLAESLRVLRPGGKIVITTPFAHQIHGSPMDYYRYTDSAFFYLCKAAGFKKITVAPLLGGLASVVHQFTLDWQPSFIRMFTTPLAKVIDFLGNYLPFYKRLTQRIPLGYIVQAKKAK